MLRIRWLVCATLLAPLLPSNAAAQFRPMTEVHGSLWRLSGTNAAGIGLFVGASARHALAGVSVDWAPASNERRGIVVLQGTLGSRFALSDVVRLGFDFRVGTLESYGGRISYYYPCIQVGGCVPQSSDRPADWSVIGGGDASAEVGAESGPTVVVRYGVSRLFGSDLADTGLSTFDLGVRYRLR